MMRARRTLAAALGALALACSTRQDDANDTAAAAGGAATDTAAGAVSADPDANVAGTGVPAGYTGRTDDAKRNIADASYTRSGNTWEVRTGPAHVVWAPKDSASGTYTARARFEQLEAPTHPEAFGVIFGGSDLSGAGQRYGYFVVRGTGEYLVRVREGAETRTVAAWTPNQAVPKQNAQGAATYDLAVQVRPDSVRFLVNNTAVASVPKSAVPTDGIVGLRINHNLHVRTGPVVVER